MKTNSCGILAPSLGRLLSVTLSLPDTLARLTRRGRMAQPL